MPEGVDAIFNLGCDIDLWPTLGRHLLTGIHRDYPQTALSAWPGKHEELEHWLATGLIDATLTHTPITRDGCTLRELCSESLVLVATRADAPLRFDPGYVYVDAGQEFGRRHAAAYADAGVARVSFGCAIWALDFLLERGGSAYLPERLAIPHIAAGRLFRLEQGPVFRRNIYLVSNDAIADGWPWYAALENLIASALAGQ